MDIKTELFGVLDSGEKVYNYTLKSSDVSIDVINYGCIIKNIFVPDKDGEIKDIVLGYNSLKEYVESPMYFGALIGPVAGRISNGTYFIDDNKYELEKNENGITHLHGGAKGLDKIVWCSREFKKNDSIGVEFEFEYCFPEKGYPGVINYKVIYELNDNNEFSLIYKAESDQKTPVNLTNHSYFNLNGEDSGQNILNQHIQMNSKYFIPLDSNNIPTGEILSSGNTPFDFNKPIRLEDAINSDYSQIRQAGGFDHPVLMDFSREKQPQAFAHNPGNGIKLEVYTDQNCMVFYTCNGMDGTTKGKKGTPYTKQYAFCFENQGIPDAVNNRHFPTVLIDEDKSYFQKTIWKFGVK